MEKVAVAGDGLAGLMLATALKDRGTPVVVYGDGRTNTPPVGLVHLYAGRSFRRRPIEVDAFRVAVSYWRDQELAEEHQVSRWFQSGDRLERSLPHAPPEYEPRRLAPGQVDYGPGFAVAAQEFAIQLRRGLDFEKRRLEQPLGVTVWANGLEFANKLDAVWDRSEGRLVTATPRSHRIMIGGGVHLTPHPLNSSTVVGGAGSEELERAGALAGEHFSANEVWKGRRLAAALDRWPVMGWLKPGQFLFGGFGSRALFWLPWSVKQAVAALVDGERVAAEVDWRRLKPG